MPLMDTNPAPTPPGRTAPPPGPTALVTGASRGLGLTLARFLALRGHRVVMTGRERDALLAAAAPLAEHAEVIPIAGDVTDPRHRRELASATAGGLDLLVNNASDLGATPLPPLADYPLDRLRAVLETNLVAPVALVQALLPALRRRRGLVVDISSDAARGGYPGWGAYGASKAALDLVSATLASELADVAVVAVDPGDLRTRMHQEAFPGEDISDRPLPEVTLPFWAWLLGRPHEEIDGRRFEAQADTWETGADLEATA